jgi:hypothetical protein
MPRKQTVSLQDLIEKGFLQPVKRGRPALYATDEERLEVHRAQQRECVRKHALRVKEARRLMLETNIEVPCN